MDTITPYTVAPNADGGFTGVEDAVQALPIGEEVITLVYSAPDATKLETLRQGVKGILTVMAEPAGYMEFTLPLPEAEGECVGLEISQGYNDDKRWVKAHAGYKMAANAAATLEKDEAISRYPDYDLRLESRPDGTALVGFSLLALEHAESLCLHLHREGGKVMAAAEATVTYEGEEAPSLERGTLWLVGPSLAEVPFVELFELTTEGESEIRRLLLSSLKAEAPPPPANNVISLFGHAERDR